MNWSSQTGLHSFVNKGTTIRISRTSNTFFVEELNEKGGMGLVLIARRKKDKKLYALKTMKKWAHVQSATGILGAGADQEELEKFIESAVSFRRESLVWIALGKHNNIVQAYWYDSDERYRPFLIMDYVKGTPNGPSLRDWLHSERKIDLPVAVRLVLEAINGLKYAKMAINKGLNTPFVHKDIKPDNLLIGEDGALKVTDFGLVMGHGGTPNYRPPEQWENREVEEKTDVYALGCVLYEMINGYPAFWGASTEEIKQEHFSYIPVSLKEVPDDLNSLVLRCLAKFPAERPDFSELQDKLQKIYTRVTGAPHTLGKGPEELSAEDLNAMGSGFDQLGHHRKALECYNEAIQKDPRDVRFYLNRGNARLLTEDEDGANEDYHVALNLDPKLMEAQFGLGNFFDRYGEPEDAFKWYMNGKKSWPKEPLMDVNLGNFYAQRGRFDEAEKHYNQALSVRQDLAEAHLGLANVHLCRRDWKDAESEYQNAVSANPLYANAYLNMARLYQLMDRRQERDQALKFAALLMPERY